MYSHCTDHTAQMPCVHWLKTSCAPKKTFLHPRVMSHPMLHATLSTSSPSLSPASLVLQSSSSPNPDLLSTYPIVHCEDPRQDGTSTEHTPPQVMSPQGSSSTGFWSKPQNQIVDDQDDTGEIGVKKLSYSQSLVHSAYDSAESIATPADSDLEDEQLRKMLASPLYKRAREENEEQARAYHSERESLMIQSSRDPEVSGKPDAECVQKREANAQRTQAYHSRRESLMASSSRELEVSWKLDAIFSCHSESSQNTFSVRDRSNEPGARSELLKQEHQLKSLNSCIDELQQQAYSQRLELEDAYHGYIESRREQLE